jgi:hypothetical protein
MAHRRHSRTADAHFDEWPGGQAGEFFTSVGRARLTIAEAVVFLSLSPMEAKTLWGFFICAREGTTMTNKTAVKIHRASARKISKLAAQGKLILPEPRKKGFGEFSEIGRKLDMTAQEAERVFDIAMHKVRFPLQEVTR